RYSSIVAPWSKHKPSLKRHPRPNQRMHAHTRFWLKFKPFEAILRAPFKNSRRSLKLTLNESKITARLEQLTAPPINWAKPRPRIEKPSRSTRNRPPPTLP